MPELARSVHDHEWLAEKGITFKRTGSNNKRPIMGMQLGFETGQQPLAEWAEAGGMEFAKANLSLVDRFVAPPFSVLDARQGYWQERKRAWISLGIKSELGRGEGLTMGDSPHVTAENLNYYRNRNRTSSGGTGGEYKRDGSNLLGLSVQAEQYRKGAGDYAKRDGNSRGLARSFGQDLMRGEHAAGSDYRKVGAMGYRTQTDGGSTPAIGAPINYGPGNENDEGVSVIGTSIFDPVLCEAAYRWFCPEGGAVLDPFAGGSVRGIVAAYLGLWYTGIDLRPEQIDANYDQWATIIGKLAPAGALNREDLLAKYPAPQWITGDARDVGGMSEQYDLIFTCPPYYNLEVYSDNPADLSNAGSYSDFRESWAAIIKGAVERLRPNRFACVVVGDIRDKAGAYCNFPADTIAAFQAAGATLYNEAILVTAVGSLPIRVGAQFKSSRKLGKTHQNVLVFFKGDTRKVKDALGEMPDVSLPAVTVDDPYSYRAAIR